ncbi:MAG: ATP-binding cassette domain-containing protein, partial [Clostridia bacterium]|nr:ATP-binding cassette domain-containing protein [Clostridia bacterium]
IGEHGAAVSEGQAQRLAAARALLSDAPVLLLDEATSALDEDTEKSLLKNIRALENKTVLLISHKAAARDVCDLEISVEGGALREIAK